MSVSHVARLYGIQPSLLFKWKKQYQEGSLAALAAGEIETGYLYPRITYRLGRAPRGHVD